MAVNLAGSRCTTDSVKMEIDGVRKIKLEDGMADDSRQEICNKLRNKNYYENVFTWDMRNASKNSENMILEFKTIDKIRKSLQKESEMITYNNGSEQFSLQKYCFKLTICYELFINEKYDETLMEVEDLAEYLKNIAFDKSNGQYIAAFNHMALSTYAFISISTNLDNSYKKILENLKLRSELNDIENSAIHAVKALIFMKYPSLSKHIAFNEATEACKLNFTDAEWLHIWLIAKGPLNREFDNFEEPDDNELKKAEHLLSISKSFWHLMSASNVFFKVYKYTNDEVKKEKYLELTLKNMLMAIELAGNNEHLVIKCLKVAIDQPILLLPKSIIEEKIKMLHNFEHDHINGLIGNYYLKHIKDYIQAKDYFFRRKETDVICVLKILKIECILKPLDEIPIIETLSNAYNTFSNSKSRVKILSQILLYYTYYKEEEDKMLHHFKLFMHLPFDNAFKYRHLISVIPIFEIKNFHREKFVKDLSNKIEYVIKNCECNSDDKKCLNDTLQRFSKMVTDTLNDKYLKQIGLNHLNANVQVKLNDIMNNYESIFSWKIKLLTGHHQNLLLSVIDRVREKFANCSDKEDEFSEDRFYYQLIMCYELYSGKNYDESLMEIKNIVKYLQSCKFNEANEQYLVAYNHIAQTTYGFIALTLNLDFKMDDIKLVSNFNEVQKAALCALKAKVFLEYLPKGNEIALKFSKQAFNLNPTEPNYLAIWLKAKGRVRRYYHPHSMPDTDEFDAAELLCSYKLPLVLIQVSTFYSETAYFFKYDRKQEESSDNYYQLSSDIMLKVIELAQDNIQYLSACLLMYVEYPTECLSNSVMENLIQKLSNVKSNSCLDQALASYYFKLKKDYKKAKIYLARGMAGGSFRCAMQLIRVECLLQSVDEFPLVQTLNMMYDTFSSPKRRLIILTQILMYYCYYCGYDNKSIMYYLRLYLDQDIEDGLKKHHLINAFPNFNIGYFKRNTFFDILLLKIKTIKKYHTCSVEDEKTFDCLDKLSKLQLNENNLFNDKKTDVHNQNDDYYTNSNKQYPNRTLCNYRNNELCSWRKQPNTNIDQNYGHGIHVSEVSSWRNHKDRYKNQSEPIQADMNWRFQNKNSNNEQVLETNVVFGKGKTKYT